jgi:hypothetical protein
MEKSDTIKRALLFCALAFMISCNPDKEIPYGEYVSGDFHQHTTYSGGEYSFGHVMQADNKFGLDWWSNSDHGGVRELWGKVSGLDYGSKVTWTSAGIKLEGDIATGEDTGFMWRWQCLKIYNFEDVLLWRKVYPGKLILQAFEWNVPGHEHANISIISNQFDSLNPNCDPLAQFEYMFDDEDKDTTGGKQFGWVKSKAEGKAKARDAARWLQENYAGKAYVVESHPDKSGKYSIADFRDFNTIAPDVFFGFDGMPGHQKKDIRGSYDLEDAMGIATVEGRSGATYGGAGVFMSKIGGLWDAMLSEGRHWWISASSDFHDNEDFYPGQYQKTYTFVTRRKDPQALIDGLRSGNTFIATGGLITALDYKIEGSMMGQSLKTEKDKILIEISVFDPDAPNFNTFSDYTNPKLDHIDIIAGEVSGIIPADSPDYSKDKVSTTRLIARFDSTGGIVDDNGIESIKWIDQGNGWKKISYKADLKGKMYFRLRGTNHPVRTAGETDGAGNPLFDAAGENDAAKAFSDLWFYSNPVFVEKISK